MIKGLDVSRYNDNFRNEAKGCDWIVVKAGEDKRATNTKYDEQIKFARDGGFVVATYYWLRPGDPVGQARWYVDKHRPRAGELLICDFEKQNPDLESRDPTFSEVKDFIAEVKRLAPDNKVGLYVNKDYWETRAKKSRGGADFLWLAWYTSDRAKVENYPGWLWWQYQEGPDYNWAKFDTKAEMLAWAKGSATPKPNPVDPPKYDPPPLKERVSWRKTPGGNPVRACTCMIENITKVVEPRMKAAGVIKYSVDIYQGAYSTSASQSANTHAGGGAIDVDQRSDAAIKIWRESGWDMWRRGADYGFDPHAHGVLRGCPHLSSAAKGQHTQYKNGDNGLADHANDPHGSLGRPMITWREAIEKYYDAPPVAGGGGGDVTPEPTEGIEVFMTEAKWERYSTDKAQKAAPNSEWQYLKITDAGNVSLTAGPARVIGEIAVQLQMKQGASAYFRVVEDDIDSKGKGSRRTTYRNHKEIVGTAGGTYEVFPLLLQAGGPKKGYRDNLVRIQWHCSDPNAVITYAEVGRFSTGR